MMGQASEYSVIKTVKNMGEGLWCVKRVVTCFVQDRASCGLAH